MSCLALIKFFSEILNDLLALTSWSSILSNTSDAKSITLDVADSTAIPIVCTG